MMLLGDIWTLNHSWNRREVLEATKELQGKFIRSISTYVMLRFGFGFNRIYIFGSIVYYMYFLTFMRTIFVKFILFWRKAYALFLYAF